MRPSSNQAILDASVSLEDLALQAVERACKAGATGAECTIIEGNEFSVKVRMGEIEALTEAGARGAGLRVLWGQQSGSSYTSDLSEEGIRRMVEAALTLAKITSADPFAGLPDPQELGQLSSDLLLYSPAVEELSAAEKIALAQQAEAAALGFDPRIVNSDGASFDSYFGSRIFANSLGFVGRYRTSSCSLSVVPVARQNGDMERDYWYTAARSPERLESPEVVGQKAAARAIRRLGARKLDTQRVPVVFEPRTAQTLLGHIFEAVSGEAVYRGESFLAGKLGESVAALAITLLDDGTMPGLFGTSPFDDEGVPTRRTPVIQNGVLQNYLLNTYAARKLGMKTTGNAARGLSGNPGVGHGNFYLQPGAMTPEEIIRRLPRGLYVTELLGFGVNLVTGDYSRGAAGVWIEQGELTYAVSEVTIASTLQEILRNIEAVGSDLEFRGSIAAPTLLISEMTLSGK